MTGHPLKKFFIDCFANYTFFVPTVAFFNWLVNGWTMDIIAGYALLSIPFAIFSGTPYARYLMWLYERFLFGKGKPWAEVKQELNIGEDDATRVNRMLKKGHCPDCTSKQFYAGPEAPGAQNMKCATCWSEFNVTLIGVSRISDPHPRFEDESDLDQWLSDSKKDMPKHNHSDIADCSAYCPQYPGYRHTHSKKDGCPLSCPANPYY